MKEQATNQVFARLVQVSQTKRAAKFALILNAGSSSLKFALYDAKSLSEPRNKEPISTGRA